MIETDELEKDEDFDEGEYRVSMRRIVDIAIAVLMETGGFDTRAGGTEELYNLIHDSIAAVNGLELKELDHRFEIMCDNLGSRLGIHRPSNATLKILIDQYSEFGGDLTTAFHTGDIRDVVDRCITPFALNDELPLLYDEESPPRRRRNSISAF